MRGFIDGFEQMTNTATKMSSLRYFVRSTPAARRLSRRKGDLVPAMSLSIQQRYREFVAAGRLEPDPRKSP